MQQLKKNEEDINKLIKKNTHQLDGIWLLSK